MPLKKTILAAGTITLLLLTTLLVILLFPKNTEEQPAETTTPDVQYLFDLNDIDCIEQLSFTYEKNEAVSVSKAEDGWQITDRPGLPIEDAVISSWLDQLAQMLALRVVTNDCHDLDEYGMDTPTLSLTVVTDGVNKTYLFGSYNSHFEGYYCTVKGTTAVYLLDKSYADAYDVTVPQLLRQEKFPQLMLPASIGLTDTNGNEIPLNSANEAKLGDLLSSLTIDRMVDYGTERYGVYGLDHATVFTLSRADGSPLTLRFSEGETQELIYLVIDEKELIYLIACEDMEALLSYIRMTA